VLVNATTFSDQLAGVLDGWIAADNRQVSCEAIFKQKNTTLESRFSVPLKEEHFVAGAGQYLLSSRLTVNVRLKGDYPGARVAPTMFSNLSLAR
jgi:hypothetical protein